MSKGPFDNLALKFTEELFRNTKTIETEEVRNKEFEIKKAKVYYSINMLLNESSKLLILAILAILLHIFTKYIFCLIILMLTRSILGGLHGKSYLQCLLITMLCIGLAIYASPFIVMNYWIAGIILAIWCILVITIGPIQSKNRLKIKAEKRKKNKIYLLVMSVVLFGITMLVGHEYNQMYIFLLLFQMVGVIIK